MESGWTSGLWRQFGAAIDMLEKAIDACPESLWGDRSRNPEYWYLLYHTLFWLDLYLHGSFEGFAPPAPYTLDELDPRGLFPDRVYTKAEMKRYLAHCREKCRAAIAALTEERAGARCAIDRFETAGELFIYNLRHVQHHAAQLYLILRQTIDSTPGWVDKTGHSLHTG